MPDFPGNTLILLCNFLEAGFETGPRHWQNCRPAADFAGPFTPR
jgi:hypothetical protein